MLDFSLALVFTAMNALLGKDNAMSGRYLEARFRCGRICPLRSKLFMVFGADFPSPSQMMALKANLHRKILKPVRIFSDTGFTCILLWICNKFSASERGHTAPFIYVSTVTGTGIAPGHNIEGALRGSAEGL